MGCVTAFLFLDKDSGNSQIQDVVCYRTTMTDDSDALRLNEIRANQLQQYSYTGRLTGRLKTASQVASWHLAFGPASGTTYGDSEANTLLT